MKEAEPADYPKMLRVVEVNPELERTTEVLGLTDERMEILDKKCNEAMSKANSLTQALVALSKQVENANELAFLCLQLGVSMGKEKDGKAGPPKAKPSPTTGSVG
ncbi:MAG: hypothetical protein E6Q36_02255 [Chryseobacterium sp.]|nr:MAG: hypothetical protein E6Q36_02255 [Chryseobacterium sp.]